MAKGKLKFKGEKDLKKKKKKVKHESSTFEAISTREELIRTSDPTDEIVEKNTLPPPKMLQGDGKITSSSTVITGLGTTFLKTLNVGDAIIVDVPLKDGTFREEMRIITMRLSDASANISSAFTNDLSRPTSYRYINKPKSVDREKADTMKKDKLSREELEKSAVGTYSSAGGKEFVYRERTEHGGYRIKKERVSDDVSRTQLLQMRAQKKADKYC